MGATRVDLGLAAQGRLTTRLSRSSRPGPTAGVGRKSGSRRHRRVTAVGFGQGTFAGTHRNGQDAP